MLVRTVVQKNLVQNFQNDSLVNRNIFGFTFIHLWHPQVGEKVQKSKLKLQKWQMRLPKWGMGGWKLTWVNNQTQKILHTAIRFLWLISFFWTSKDVRWSNNNRCSKVKLVWKLIFLGHFIMSLVPITEIRFILSKLWDVKSTDRFLDLRNWMVFQELIWVTGYA